MPIKPIPPRPGKTPVWYGRGEHLGEHVNASTGARERRLALKIIRKWEDEIERGVFAKVGDPTFASAAIAYMQAGGEKKYLTPLLKHFGETPLKALGQVEIDAAAEALYPGRSAATRNRQVYTPCQAILRRAGITLALRRPKGHAKVAATGWLWPEQAHRLLEEARKLDVEFGIMLVLLLGTGLRLSEVLGLRCDDVRLQECFAYIPDTKTDKPQPVHLPPAVVVELANHPRGIERPGETVFRFHKGGHLYSLLIAAAFKAGVDLPARQKFHILRHTYATWMRRFAGADLQSLLGTNWKSIKSVQRYTHVVVSEEAKRADLLPLAPAKKRRRQ